MEIRLWRIGCPPGRIKARLGGAFDAEKVRAPYRGRTEVQREAAKRDRDFGGPNFGFLVDVSAALHTGIRVGAFAVLDIEIDAKTVGTDFEFAIVDGVSRIRVKQDFDH